MNDPLEEGKFNKGGRNDPPKTLRPSIAPPPLHSKEIESSEDKITIHARMYRKVYGSLCRQLEIQKDNGRPGPIISSIIDDILLAVADEIVTLKEEMRNG
jgi:hypothetical protein